MKTEVLHFNEGGLLGDIQHHMPGTARRFDASLRLNGQPLQLPDRMGWWWVGGWVGVVGLLGEKHVILFGCYLKWVKMKINIRSCYFWEMWLFLLLQKLFWDADALNLDMKKLPLQARRVLGLFFFFLRCLCCIFTPKKLNIALTLSSLFRGYVTMLNFLVCGLS